MSLAKIGICAALLVLAACAAPPSSEVSPSSGGTPSSLGGQAAAIGCGNDIDLLAPDGSEISLTGLWTEAEFADVALWNIRQVGDCFFMVYRDPGGDTDYSDQICDGRIQANFEITGRCVDFRGLSGNAANLQPQVFLIDFDGSNELYLQRCPRSRAVGSCDEPMIRFDPDAEPSETPSPS